MKRTFTAVFVLLFILSVAAISSDEEWCFVQIADTQLGFTNGNGDLRQDIESFEVAVAYINQLKPAFVVISGDLINAPHDPKQIRAFWNVARKIRPDVPLHLIPGNHDIGQTDESNVRSYCRLFGPDHYSFECNGSSFIVLDSVLIKDTDKAQVLYDAQEQWFRSELEKAEETHPVHIFVLTHHPWFISRPDEPEEYFNIAPAKRKEYLDLMKSCGVDFALAGHLHREAVASDGPVTMITTSAISKSLGKEPVGLRVFYVRGREVKHTYYTLDQVRAKAK